MEAVKAHTIGHAQCVGLLPCIHSLPYAYLICEQRTKKDGQGMNEAYY